MSIYVKRVYDHPTPGDGFRVLVDRVWPRGVSKEHAAVDLWAKDVAPSTELRKWFGHDPKKWLEFQEKYRQELERSDALTALQFQIRGKTAVTLVYGAKDEEHNQAVVLCDVLHKSGHS